jgi:hypothetical protein
MASAEVLPVSLASGSMGPMVCPSAALRLGGVVTRRITVELVATRSSENAVLSHLFLRPRLLLLLYPLFPLRHRPLENAVPPPAKLARVSFSRVSRPSAAQSTTTVVTQKGTAERVATLYTATADRLVPALAHLSLRLLRLVPLPPPARLLM